MTPQCVRISSQMLASEQVFPCAAGMQGICEGVERVYKYRGDVEGVADTPIGASHLSLHTLLSLHRTFNRLMHDYT